MQLISAGQAKEAAKQAVKDTKSEETRKLQTIMKNIKIKSEIGKTSYCYYSYLTKGIAKTLIELGYTLTYRGKYRYQSVSSGYGFQNRKTFDKETAKELTLKDFRTIDTKFDFVLISWGDNNA